MFNSLTEKLQGLLSSIAGKKVLTEDNISEAVKTIRLALLDADVNFGVVSQFVNAVKEKALGESVLKSVDPAQQFTKIVHDELVALMGSDEVPLELTKKPAVLMLCGLQGSGKTTTCAKLAAYIGKKEIKKKILLAACDLQRPAAVEQLKKLGRDIGVDVFSIDGEMKPILVAKKALEKVNAEQYDVLIVDTAGRLHLDEVLMKELTEISKLLSPSEVLFVANAGAGQDVVRVAAEFDKGVGITGSILTMLDGSARAGAAISIRHVTKKPLKFEGIGEKIGDFQLFNPKSMADRILGMGDVINLVKKAEEHFNEEESRKMEQKLRKATFTYADYLQQMGMVKKMGSLKSLLKMLPGMSSLGDLDFSDKQFAQTEAVVLSMTFDEREEKVELSHSRRKRIAKGSGVALEEVNRMVKGFARMKQLMKNMPDLKKMKGIPSLSGLQDIKNQMKGNKWR